MLKDTTYQEKFQMLDEWMEEIIDTVKRDLKTEHLKKDWAFFKKYFGEKNINKMSTEDLVQGYRSAIANAENGETIGEFIASRWLLKNTEIYQYFEAQLSSISSDFSSLTQLDLPHATKIMEGSVSQFGALKTYLFSVFNSVVFPESVFTQLRKKAQEQVKHEEKQHEETKGVMLLEDLRKSHERDIARLTDKYEKKLIGMQKKYLIDTEGFKKQIAHLQRKLLEK